MTGKHISFSKIRTRYAPSPTGSLHLGGLRTALYNFLFAKKYNGAFILRIEDTDKTREVKGATETICRNLEEWGIPYDAGPFKPDILGVGPYIQSQRLNIYHKYINVLLEKGAAYHCFCSPERLQKIKSKIHSGEPEHYDRFCLTLTKPEIHENLKKNIPHTIRLKVPPGIANFTDFIRGKLSIPHSRVDDQILIKSDKFPTYHFASVVDDHLMEISHVIRGEEWLASVPKHIILYNAFGWTPPVFVHLPLLINPDKTKISKRQGDAGVDHYKEKGYSKAALINFISLLGWSPVGTQEIFSLDELIKEFSLERLHKAPAVVNHEKLKWFNEQHLRKSNIKQLVAELKPLVLTKLKDLQVEIQEFPDEYYAKVITTIKERIDRVAKIPELCLYFFTDPEISKERNDLFHKMFSHKALHLIKKLIPKLQAIEESNWNSESFNQSCVDVLKDYHHEISHGNFFSSLRYILTGTNVGAGVPQTAETLGKKVVISRLEGALDELK